MISGSLLGKPPRPAPVLPQQPIAASLERRSNLVPLATRTGASSSSFGRVLAERRALAGNGATPPQPAASSRDGAHAAAIPRQPIPDTRVEAAILSTSSTSGSEEVGSALGAAAARVAQQLLGDRYVWSGHAPGGFDCSGLTWYVYQQLGVRLPMHDLAGQLSAGRQVPRDQLQEGDLVFFRDTYRPGLSHVGIALGGDRFLHALSEQRGVTISRLDEPYWSQRYYGASRPSIAGGLS